MSLLSIVILIAMPVMLAGFIWYDLSKSKKLKVVIDYKDKAVMDRLSDLRENHGDRLSKDIIMANGDYIISNYKNAIGK